jgi:hypothetical protein
MQAAKVLRGAINRARVDDPARGGVQSFMYELTERPSDRLDQTRMEWLVVETKLDQAPAEARQLTTSWIESKTR